MVLVLIARKSTARVNKNVFPLHALRVISKESPSETSEEEPLKATANGYRNHKDKCELSVIPCGKSVGLC